MREQLFHMAITNSNEKQWNLWTKAFPPIPAHSKKPTTKNVTYKMLSSRVAKRAAGGICAPCAVREKTDPGERDDTCAERERERERLCCERERVNKQRQRWKYWLLRRGNAVLKYFVCHFF
jgi:hypothetical protein